MLANPIPNYSKSPSEYFTTVLNFLKQEQWIYNYPNTHILVNNILDNFEPNWIECFKCITNTELNHLPFGNVNNDWPESLQRFIKKIFNLKYEVEEYKSRCERPVLRTVSRLSVKKAHEIACLAVVVHDLCQKHDISVVVDVGAGLGYLSYLLHEKYNYKVLAIEGNKETYDLAIKNQIKHHPNTKDHVKFVHYFITDKSTSAIKLFLEDSGWNSDKVCITGLHACADLSVTILDIFQNLDVARAIGIMPCCYHRMEIISETKEEERFRNFPLSKILCDVYKNLNAQGFLRRPFLRLACQQTGSSWKCMSAEDHSDHSQSCLLRAILQEIANEENLEVKRLKRKSGKLKDNVEGYINNIKFTHKLIRSDGTDYIINNDTFSSIMLEKWKSHKDKCNLVEVLTAFQTAIQAICENVILLDRVQYLREKGINGDIYKVTDDHISPRCHALVANK